MYSNDLGSGISSLFSSQSRHSNSRGRSRRRSSSTSFNTRSSTMSSMLLDKKEKDSEGYSLNNSNAHIAETVRVIDVEDNAFYVNEKEGQDSESDVYDTQEPSIILNPAQPTPREREWLDAMCEGMKKDAVALFERRVFSFVHSNIF